jgi:NAD(P)-dependent dehydrogenase (short-subunit alcohol dehydrogenase family)
VNNAGIFIAKPFAEYSPDDYARLVNTNFAGFVRMTQAALGVMKGPGHIVNISTTLAVQPNVAVPSALPVLIKGGIEAATRALATELAAREIRVNAIAPGIVDTPMHTRESHDFLRKLTPGGRIAAVSDIAEALLYLEGARFVSGEILHVDGGAHAGKWS